MKAKKVKPSRFGGDENKTMRNDVPLVDGHQNKKGNQRGKKIVEILKLLRSVISLKKRINMEGTSLK